MSKRVSRVIACIMLVIGVIFAVVVLNNPQLSWPWSNTITHFIDLIYLIVMDMLFAISFKKEK